ncbi:hypothetical protein [Rubripirellula reticaptiva]|uniref:Transmembrane protein n=1 Tax=Rubripirellula reticaptiva TaxID=2528013 RepID=A0A5C6EXB3_9BACT|nr:hypothetical protein [Rubripirellula reticaptiva]TWU51851.1 hypothetical protein Poly59_34460 [Rubripirellula reticaptiva]
MSNQDPFDQANPYAPSSGPSMALPTEGNLNASELKKAEAIIKDARQFWLGILLCFLCSGFGMVIIGPWYLTRLLQWNKMSKQHPFLMNPEALPLSLPKRFQSSKWKLMAGLGFGLLMFLLLGLLLVVSFAAASQAVPRQ